MRLQVQSLASLSELGIWPCREEAGHRHSSDLALLWLWHRLAAIAPIQPLAWEPPYAMDEALKSKNKQIKKT